jgi:Concanavalin A-like lectin/glucanases superfamily
MPRWLGGSTSGGNDAYTKILLHLDGNVTDTAKGISSPPRTWTNNGPCTFTSTAKFTQSIITNTNKWIDTPDSPDFSIGMNDFTVDFWFRIGGVGDGTFRSFCGQESSAGTDAAFEIDLTTANKIEFFIASGTSSANVTGTRTFLATDTSFHHVACVRKNGVMRIFIDGAQDGSDVSANFAVHDSASKFAIGRAGEVNGQYFIGEIDEFRFSKGIARWFSNFTPPTRAYLPT